VRVTDLIAATRDGRAVSGEDLYRFASGVGSGSVPDYQVSAWLMAAYIRGLTEDETLGLTLAMRDSGTVIEWEEGPPLADKHSTGGVGDKISLVLAPLAAACGMRVPMISGRSLGHTGGTLDKLESIPGMDVGLPLREFVDLVNSNGVAMIGQSDELAPADRKMYALRDSTSTVTSIPLICASILSKKLAENTDALVFDVKVGRGAFMRSETEALELARTLTRIAGGAGVGTEALITSMDHPLGRMTGNTLEVREAIEVLQGGGPRDVRELTLELAASMLLCSMPGDYGNRSGAMEFCSRRLDDGSAMDRFAMMVESQGGDLAAFESLPPAPFMVEVSASRSGLYGGMDAYEVGEAVRSMGGGRYSIDDRIRHDVGWEQLVPAGTEVRAGEVLGMVHGGSGQAAEEAAARIGGSGIWEADGGRLVRSTL